MEATLLIISLPSSTPMTQAQFYTPCQANRDLCIERATGEVIIMPPAFSETGNRNFNLAVQLEMWTEKDGMGLGFDSAHEAGFRCNAQALGLSGAAVAPSKKQDKTQAAANLLQTLQHDARHHSQSQGASASWQTSAVE